MIGIINHSNLSLFVPFFPQPEMSWIDVFPFFPPLQEIKANYRSFSSSSKQIFWKYDKTCGRVFFASQILPLRRRNREISPLFSFKKRSFQFFFLNGFDPTFFD